MRKTFFNTRANNGAVRRPTTHYPSAQETGHSTEKKAANRYGGDAVVGIALLHKQAYAPVTAPIKTDPKKQ